MNTLAPSREKKISFSSAITGDSLQNLIRKSVASPEAASRFTGTLISAVASTPQLQACKPATVVAAALRGEGMGLSLGREFHLVPFGDSCAFVISYKGLISLCLAGNDVADMDCIEVRDGEYVGRDRRTKRPQFDFSVYETDEEAAQHKVIGYMAYVEMKDGYFRSEYMTVPDILAHASRYSKAFDVEKYMKLQSGDMTPQEAERLKQGSPWYGNFDLMCRKTVIRGLLNSGYVRLANSAAVRDAISYDTAADENILPDLGITEETEAPVVTEAVAVEVTEAQEAAETPQKAEKPQETGDKPEKPKRGRSAKKRDQEEIPAETDEEAVQSFFDEVGAV